MRASVGGIVLAGGAGERFGGRKAVATLGGMTIAARAVSLTARAIGGGPIVVSIGKQSIVPTDLPDGVIVARDEISDAGPLAGLSAALTVLGDSAEVAVACVCDAPLTHPSVLSLLAGKLLQTDRDACVPADEEGRPIPFPSAWRTSIASRAAGALGRGERSPARFATTLNLDLLDRDVLIEDETVRAGDPKLHSLDDVDERGQFDAIASSPPRIRTSNRGRLTVERAWTVTQLLTELNADEDSPCTVNDRPIAAFHDFALVEGDSVVIG